MDDPRGASVEDGGRVFFRDVKPYAIVDRLDQLRGPARGTVDLSHSVLWAPGGGLVDLDRPGALRMAYRAVLNEGTVEDLVRVLNRDVSDRGVARAAAAVAGAGDVGVPIP